MKPNIPPTDNHVNVMTGARRTWKYGERKVVRIENNTDGLVVGIEEATKEGFGFLGKGHDVARIEYGRYYIIEFREGGPLNGYWAIACEQPEPTIGTPVTYQGKEFFVAARKIEPTGWTVVLSEGPAPDEKYVPWSHCVPATDMETLWERAAVRLLNRRLNPDLRASYSNAQAGPVGCIEIWNRRANVPILRLWLSDPGRTVFLMVEGVLRDYGLPVGVPDLER